MTEDKQADVIKAFEAGTIVATATDTVWGLLVNGADNTAVERLYELKQRDITKQLILFVSQSDKVNGYATFIPEYAHAFMEAFWPGPLTLVFKTNQKIYAQQGTETIGIRMPEQKDLLALIQSTDDPVLSTSANISNTSALSSAEGIQTFFGDEVMIWQPDGPKVIDGQVVLPSTVIDCQDENSWLILREGAITKEQLWEVRDKMNFKKKEGNIE